LDTKRSDHDGGMILAEDVARELKVSPITVKKWLRKGALRGYKFGNRWRTTQRDLDTFVASRANAKLEEA
jgi:excisionase family DNA binding protein